MTIIWSIVGFALLIGILVTIHEWGHFAVARFFNVKVLEFSIGFWKPIAKIQRGETEYRIGLIPLGGYVKFLDERVAPVAEHERARAFNQQNVYKRFAIVLAGPLINLLFAWFIFVAINLIGITSLKPVFVVNAVETPLAQALGDHSHQAWWLKSVDEKTIVSWQDVQQLVLQALVHDQPQLTLNLEAMDQPSKMLKSVVLDLSSLDINAVNTPWLSALGFQPKTPPMLPIIGQVADNSAAQRGGLQTGDRIMRIADQPMQDWMDVVAWVREHPNRMVEIVFQRNQAEYTTTIQLDAVHNDNQTIGRLGAAVDQSQALLKEYYVLQRYGLVESLQRGWDHSINIISMTLVMLKKMLFGQVGLEHLSGPISIANFSGQALESGLISFLGLMGLLSLSLGILNLLPIPMLDGGHLLYYLIEMVRGRPVSEQVEEIGFRIGLLIIVGLTILALTNDVVRITNG
jgi:regulator of sigma E protease